MEVPSRLRWRDWLIRCILLMNGNSAFGLSIAGPVIEVFTSQAPRIGARQYLS